MKKLMPAFLLIIACQACFEAEPMEPETAPTPNTRMLLKKYHDTYNSEWWDFTYNADSTLSTMSRTMDRDHLFTEAWTFEYIPGTRKVSRMIMIGPDDIVHDTFIYGTDGKPDSATRWHINFNYARLSDIRYARLPDGTPEKIYYTWYSLYPTGTENIYTVSMEEGNVVSYTWKEVQLDFTYDDKKNPFYELGVVSKQVLFHNHDEGWQFLLSKNNPVSKTVLHEGEVNYVVSSEWTYNEAGYPMTAKLLQAGDSLYSIRYSYYE